MPNLNEIGFTDSEGNKVESLPKVEDLEEGEQLHIVSISQPEKTPQNGYEMIKLVDADRGEMITLATGVRNKLKAALEAVEEKVISFDEDDPLLCTVTNYKAHGKTCVGLN